VARAHFRDVLLGQRADGAVVPLAGAAVAVYQTGTALPVLVPLYATAAGATTLPNPLTADPSGAVEFWLDADDRVDLAVSATGYAAQTVTVEVLSESTETGTSLVSPTLTNPTLSGTVTGAPAWASSQAFAQGASVAGTGLLANAINLSTSNLLLGGTGQRITGDFSNATASNRVLLQSATTNGSTIVGAVPNGTNTGSQLLLYNAADPNNAGRARFFVSGTGAGINAQASGAGSIPTALAFSGFASYTFDGTIGFNGAAAVAKPTVTGSRGGNAALASLLTALASYGLITDSTTA
jgi:hypothetical protein